MIYMVYVTVSFLGVESWRSTCNGNHGTKRRGNTKGRAFVQLAHCNMVSAAHYMETIPMQSLFCYLVDFGDIYLLLNAIQTSHGCAVVHISSYFGKLAPML
jgi:hypothetical protein